MHKLMKRICQQLLQALKTFPSNIKLWKYGRSRKYATLCFSSEKSVLDFSMTQSELNIIASLITRKQENKRVCTIVTATCLLILYSKDQLEIKS